MMRDVDGDIGVWNEYAENYDSLEDAEIDMEMGAEEYSDCEFWIEEA